MRIVLSTDRIALTHSGPRVYPYVERVNRFHHTRRDPLRQRCRWSLTCESREPYFTVMAITSLWEEDSGAVIEAYLIKTSKRSPEKSPPPLMKCAGTARGSRDGCDLPSGSWSVRIVSVGNEIDRAPYLIGRVRFKVVNVHRHFSVKFSGAITASGAMTTWLFSSSVGLVLPFVTRRQEAGYREQLSVRDLRRRPEETRAERARRRPSRRERTKASDVRTHGRALRSLACDSVPGINTCRSLGITSALSHVLRIDILRHFRAR